MNHLFLHGGGDSEAANKATFGRFVSHCRSEGPLVLIVVETDARESEQARAYYADLFAGLGIARSRLAILFPTPSGPLLYEQLAAYIPSGVFVCGGVTPDYHAALCLDRGWLRLLQETGIPYGGTSAGAAIAAETAILGGWRTPLQLPDRPIIYSGAGEGLTNLITSPGLGLAPFAIDVHAGQWGTLTRLIQAVDCGLVPEGWAIDENTQLEVSDMGMQVFGIGHAYRVDKDGQEIRLRVHTADVNVHDPA